MIGLTFAHRQLQQTVALVVVTSVVTPSAGRWVLLVRYCTSRRQQAPQVAFPFAEEGTGHLLYRSALFGEFGYDCPRCCGALLETLSEKRPLILVPKYPNPLVTDPGNILDGRDLRDLQVKVDIVGPRRMRAGHRQGHHPYRRHRGTRR